MRQTVATGYRWLSAWTTGSYPFLPPNMANTGSTPQSLPARNTKSPNTEAAQPTPFHDTHLRTVLSSAPAPATSMSQPPAATAEGGTLQGGCSGCGRGQGVWIRECATVAIQCSRRPSRTGNDQPLGVAQAAAPATVHLGAGVAGLGATSGSTLVAAATTNNAAAAEGFPTTSAVSTTASAQHKHCRQQGGAALQLLGRNRRGCVSRGSPLPLCCTSCAPSHAGNHRRLATATTASTANRRGSSSPKRGTVKTLASTLRVGSAAAHLSLPTEV